MTTGNGEWEWGMGNGEWELLKLFIFFYFQAGRDRNLVIQRYKYSTIALKITRSPAISHKPATAMLQKRLFPAGKPN